QEMNQLYDAQDEAWEGFESGSEIKSTPENSKKFYDRVKKFVDENNIKLSKKHYDEIEEMNGHSFNEARARAGAYGEDAKKKELARNKEYSQKYKGQILDLSMIDEFKESDDENKTYWIQDNRGNRLTNEDAKKKIIGQMKYLAELEDMAGKKLNNRTANDIRYYIDYLKDRLNPEDRKEIESEAEKTQNRSEAMKGNKNAYKGKSDEELVKIRESYQALGKRSPYFKDMTREEYESALDEMYEEIDKRNLRNTDSDSFKKKETPMPKPSTGVYAPSESTNLETKKVIAENKKVGKNEVRMPYSKELDFEMKTLKNNVSSDPDRIFMNHVYYDNGNLVATDGRRLKTVKVGKLDGIEDGSYVDVNITKDGINIKRRDDMDDARFPNYTRVIPDNLTQKVTLNNDVLREKIKEMKKDGAIDKGFKRIQLEFKDGKVFLDDTEIGDAKGVKLQTGGYDDREETDYIVVNADYLSDALTGKTSTLMLGEHAKKAIAISTDSTSNII
ncbi:MAG: hypothetical protein J6T31_08165, partial [Methanobrevibacter sp.]|nr:hypothetical protein [Methanobrevibacter sp.]